jgi:threonine dehydrogenase-like Zn-dependent dehydrogenase
VQAVVYQGTRSVGVQDVAEATLEAGPGALIRVTSRAICGTDPRYTTYLRDLVRSGRPRPGRVVSHHAGLEQAPKLYRQLDRRQAGVIKVALDP